MAQTDILDRKAKLKQPTLSAAEIERRRQSLAFADTHNRLEGISRSPASDEVFAALVRGEIDEAEVLKRIKALPHQL